MNPKVDCGNLKWGDWVSRVGAIMMTASRGTELIGVDRFVCWLIRLGSSHRKVLMAGPARAVLCEGACRDRFDLDEFGASAARVA